MRIVNRDEHTTRISFVNFSCQTYVTFTATVTPGGSVRVIAKLTVEFTQSKMVVCNRRFGATCPIVKGKAVQTLTL
jgi:hypothetical protein